MVFFPEMHKFSNIFDLAKNSCKTEWYFKAQTVKIIIIKENPLFEYIIHMIDIKENISYKCFFFILFTLCVCACVFPIDSDYLLKTSINLNS